MTCFICDPENPDAEQEGCADCEASWVDWILEANRREFWDRASQVTPQTGGNET